jgi:hypothetical protein
MNRRIPNGTYGGVRGRGLITRPYSISQWPDSPIQQNRMGIQQTAARRRTIGLKESKVRGNDGPHRTWRGQGKTVPLIVQCCRNHDSPFLRRLDHLVKSRESLPIRSNFGFKGTVAGGIMGSEQGEAHQSDEGTEV